MRWALVISAISISLLVGCSFNTRSNSFACETVADCPDGRACDMGWCVVSDSITPDAEVVTIDAAMIDAAIDPPDAMPDAVPAPECLACTGGTCTEDCALAGNCAYDCAIDGCDCSFSCTATATKCNGECKVGTTCSVDCGGAKQCHPKCKAGAICDFDCTGVKDCKKARCEGDAQCLLNCTDAMGPMDCKWEVCGGVELSCAGDILACGRPCPVVP